MLAEAVMPPYRFHDVHEQTLDMIAETSASLHGFDPGRDFELAAERCCDPWQRELLVEPSFEALVETLSRALVG